MILKPDTTIDAIIKAHPKALDAIVGLSPKFKKLYNPILRKLMAKRTTLQTASKIGNVKPEDFYLILQPLGFEIENSVFEKPQENTELPVFLSDIPNENRICFDVRPILASDKDPLKQILEIVRNLKSREVLIILNSFEPLPLISMLKKRNLNSFVLKKSNDLYETWFYPDSDPVMTKNVNYPQPHSRSDWDQLIAEFKDNIITINVRDLPMPQPMIKILETLELMNRHQALFVHHKKVPVYLLQELEDKSYDFRLKEYSDGRVDLLIFSK